MAARIINESYVESVIDLGCRDCILAEKIDIDSYVGIDIYQNETNTVTKVIDVMEYDLPRNSECVVALDLLEHLDNPYDLVTRIFKSEPRMIILNLPNIYDIKGVVKFLQGQLGGKYTFGLLNSVDRHRWVMNNKEIVAFYKYTAESFGYRLDLTYLNNYGSVGKLLSRIFPRYFTYSITGKFEKL